MKLHGPLLVTFRQDPSILLPRNPHSRYPKKADAKPSCPRLPSRPALQQDLPKYQVVGEYRGEVKSYARDPGGSPISGGSWKILEGPTRVPGVTNGGCWGWRGFAAQCESENRVCIAGWWFGWFFLNFPINIGFMSSSQLTNIISEGWPNHQPDKLAMTKWWRSFEFWFLCQLDGVISWCWHGISQHVYLHVFFSPKQHSEPTPPQNKCIMTHDLFQPTPKIPPNTSSIGVYDWWCWPSRKKIKWWPSSSMCVSNPKIRTWNLTNELPKVVSL